MSDDIEQRLAATAQAYREYEICGQRCADLNARHLEITTEVATARERAAGEQKDVDRLEGVSLSRVLAALHHAREDDLARERAEVQAARYRVADAESRLAAVQSELAAAEARLDQLSGVPSEYSHALAARQQQLTQSSDPRGAELLSLADERGRLAAELPEIQDAEVNAQAADEALAEVHNQLGSAASWMAQNMMYHGDAQLANIGEHAWISQAAATAAKADRLLATLRTELADLAQAEPTAPQLQLSGGLQFADLFINNLFTSISNLAVQRQISEGQQRVAQARQLVADVRHRLSSQASSVQTRLAEIESRRQQLLTSSS